MSSASSCHPERSRGIPRRNFSGDFAGSFDFAQDDDRVFSIFAGVALLLTAIGIYGVMAYSVAQRRQEIGIRMALGAQRSNVMRLIVGGGMRLTAVGVVVGIAAALALTRLLETLLYGVRPFDPPTLGGVAILLALIALLACWLPAARAARSNPITALRES